MRLFNIALFILVVAATVRAQALDCTASAPVTPHARAEGEAEPVGDVVVVCTGGAASAATLINVTLTLNTDLTSLTFATVPVTSEALLLIDEPQPDAVNDSNGFSYSGQVLGTPFAAAGAPGSGNVYQAEQSAPTSVTWSGVPFVAPGPDGTRTLRLTNIRANASALQVGSSPAPVYATVSATIPIGNPSQIVAFVAPGLSFGEILVVGATAQFTFRENFIYAFRMRITPATEPLTKARQDIPGTYYYTESQFTPCFSYGDCSSPPAGPIGLATTPTLLLARIANLGYAAGSVLLPNQVQSETGSLAAALVVDPKMVRSAAGASYGGTYFVPVTGGSVDVLYEVAGSAGHFGCHCNDSFTISAILYDRSTHAIGFPTATVFKGYLAPLELAATASPTASRPRFAP